MKVTFLTAVLNVGVPRIAGRGDRISGSLFLANDSALLRELLQPVVMEAIGGLEVASLTSAPAFVYSREDVDEANFDWRGYLTNRLHQVKLFFHTMWLFKDNAVDSELGFVFYPHSIGTRTHSNSIAVAFSKADRKREVVSFSQDELSVIRRFFSDAVEVVQGGKPPLSHIAREYTRFERAFYWIQAARSAPDLGMRIAAYCSAFETMLSTSPSEVSHQLSERLAILLDGAEDKVRAYRTLKRAYSIRSKIVHGSGLRSSELAQLSDLSVACDQYARGLFRRIFSDEAMRDLFSGGIEQLDAYFLNLLLGQPSDANTTESGKADGAGA